jgi:TolA-binding protein
MKHKLLLIFILVLAFFIPANSQQTLYYLQDDANYKRGIELLEKEKYSTAQQFFELSFEKYRDSRTELRAMSQYYMAFCAVRLFNDDAEFLTVKFINDNPESPLINTAYFNLAGYFYARKKWANAIDYYKKTNPDQLEKDLWGEYYFKMGYSYFEKSDTANARIALYIVKDVDTKYTAPALYYYSHIHYVEGNFQTALNGFLKLTDDKTFGPIAPYYIVQIYYKQERYKEIVDFAPKIIDNVTQKRLPEVARIAAEAFSKLSRYEESLPYFQTFLDSSNYISKDDKYQAGYAFYKAGSYDKAIGLFGSISNTESALGQNASYYLADCYIRTNDKQRARLAFQSASGMNFDPVIRQDALFNYALLTFELSNDPFNEAIRSFQEFIAQYPESKRIDEAYRYLIQSFLNARNYRLALESLEKSELKSDDLKTAFQRIAFYRGVELFSNLDFLNAVAHFDKSLKYGSYDQAIKARAIYWKGEAFYRMNDFNKAIGFYEEFKNAPSSFATEEFALVDYNIGYSWFRLKNYENAINFLRKFTSNTPARFSREKSDAFNRIGDCFYANSDYTSAVDFYGRAANEKSGDIEYAMLQKGICLGLSNRDQQKIALLQELLKNYPSSKLYDNALYEMAQSHVKMQDIDEAQKELKQLVADFPQSNFTPGAYVQLALLYNYNGNNDAAIKYYKETINRFPVTEAAREAIIGLKNIYVDMNKVDEYISYVKSSGQTVPSVSPNEQDSLIYVSAERVYMSGDCNNSSKAFERYISNYPQGGFLLNAHFYKADCNYRNKEFDEAEVSFTYVINQPVNQFTEQSLLGIARIEIQKKDIYNAIKHYQELADNYPTPGNIKEAQVTIMENQFELKNYEEVLNTARKVKEISKLSPEIDRKATFIIARCLQEQGRSALALDEFKKISGEVMSLEGAESKFHVAELYFENKDYKNAEKEILEFSEKSSPHDYWIARSFILWADIFATNKDYFQAIQTLESIINYYEKTDDGILQMAKAKKADIVKLQEAKEQPRPPEDVEIDIE